jgi:hypothetical protein
VVLVGKRQQVQDKGMSREMERKHKASSHQLRAPLQKKKSNIQMVASQENNKELPHMKWDPHSRSKTADGIVRPDGDNLSNRDFLSRDSFLWAIDLLFPRATFITRSSTCVHHRLTELMVV